MNMGEKYTCLDCGQKGGFTENAPIKKCIKCRLTNLKIEKD